MAKKILVTGCNGQLGIALQKNKPPNLEVLALDRSNLDITNFIQVNEIVTQFKPDWIINTAAYTAVDKAESESELAFLINEKGAGNLARAADLCGSKMVQVSTDYVFDGNQARPYSPDDHVNPINVYGESKLAGEIVVKEILGNQCLILRTAWVYSLDGTNFVTSMLRLMSERKELNIVEDQIGTPTSSVSLANAIYAAINYNVTGIHHWTDAGVASWYDFANAIYELSIDAGLIKNTCHIIPIQTESYPTPATRPANSLLDKQSFRNSINDEGKFWQYELKRLLNSYKI